MGDSRRLGHSKWDLFVMESVALLLLLCLLCCLPFCGLRTHLTIQLGNNNEQGAEGSRSGARSLIKRETTRGETAKQTTTSDCICT